VRTGRAAFPLRPHCQILGTIPRCMSTAGRQLSTQNQSPAADASARRECDHAISEEFPNPRLKDPHVRRAPDQELDSNPNRTFACNQALPATSSSLRNCTQEIVSCTNLRRGDPCPRGYNFETGRLSNRPRSHAPLVTTTPWKTHIVGLHETTMRRWDWFHKNGSLRDAHSPISGAAPVRWTG